MSHAIVWNGLSQAALDAAYNNAAAVPDSAERIAKWTQRSSALRARLPAEIDIPYADGARTKFDVFRCGAPHAPLLVFIHGGWWQRNSKEVFSCMAEGPMARGFDVALLGYTLAPAASLAQIASEIRAGLDHLMAHQVQRGAASRCLLSGWSAGGHLTALTLDHTAVWGGVCVSGVFDLEPIRLSYVNDKLGLDEGSVLRFSPVRLTPCAKPLALAFGLSELPELQRQSAAYSTHCAAHGQTPIGFPMWGHDHFSILEELAASTGALVDLLANLARQHLK